MLGELSIQEIEEVLSHNAIGRIGCVDAGLVYIVPVNYRYAQNAVVCHSLEGMKIEMMRRNPQVCFEVEKIDTPTNWKTVIAWGKYEEITDEAEIAEFKSHTKAYILDKRANISALSPEQESGVHHKQPKYGEPVYYRIRFERITGRFEKSF